MLNLNEVKRHIEAGHQFYWEAQPPTGYQLRAVTYTWENGSSRTKAIYVAPNYDIAKLVCDTLSGLGATLSDSLEKIAEERYWATGCR